MKQLFSILLLAMCSGVYSQTSAYSYPAQYNPPHSSVNTELDMRVLQNMQSSYNKNYKKFNDKVNNLYKLIERLLKKNNNKLTEKQRDYIKLVYVYIDGITKTDLTSESQTYNIIKTLEKVEDNIIEWL